MGIQLKNYYNAGSTPFNSNTKAKDQLNYWETLQNGPNSNYIKAFALKVFSLVIHSRGVESLFSIMGYFKNKTKNRMSVKTLEMMSQTKLLLLEYLEFMEQIKVLQKKKIKKKFKMIF